MTKIELAVKLALTIACERASDAATAKGALLDSIIAAGWNRKGKSVDAEFSAFRADVCGKLAKINDIVTGAQGKAWADLTDIEKNARKYKLLSVLRSQSINGRKGAKKGASKRKTAKAIVIPMTPRGVSAMARVAIGALGKMEKAPFDIPLAIAAWQALATVYTKKV